MTGAEKVLEWYNNYFQTKKIVPTAREIKWQLEKAIEEEKLDCLCVANCGATPPIKN